MTKDHLYIIYIYIKTCRKLMSTKRFPQLYFYTSSWQLNANVHRGRFNLRLCDSKFTPVSLQELNRPRLSLFYIKRSDSHHLTIKFAAEISEIETERSWIHQSIGESDLLKKSFSLCVHTSSRLSVSSLQTAV